MKSCVWTCYPPTNDSCSSKQINQGFLIFNVRRELYIALKAFFMQWRNSPGESGTLLYPVCEYKQQSYTSLVLSFHKLPLLCWSCFSLLKNKLWNIFIKCKINTEKSESMMFVIRHYEYSKTWWCQSSF